MLYLIPIRFARTNSYRLPTRRRPSAAMSCHHSLLTGEYVPRNEEDRRSKTDHGIGVEHPPAQPYRH